MDLKEISTSHCFLASNFHSLFLFEPCCTSMKLYKKKKLTQNFDGVGVYWQPNIAIFDHFLRFWALIFFFAKKVTYFVLHGLKVLYMYASNIHWLMSNFDGIQNKIGLKTDEKCIFWWYFQPRVKATWKQKFQKNYFSQKFRPSSARIKSLNHVHCIT